MFKKYLSYFCLVSYYDEKFELSETDALTILQEVLKIDNSTITPSDFLRDLVESVCMLRKDGLIYTFNHRSFQEFFTAYCLARVSSDPIEEVLTKIIRRSTDQVAAMLFEMNRELVETRFIIPKLKELCDLIGPPSRSYFIDNYCTLTVISVSIVVASERDRRFSKNPYRLFASSTDWGSFVGLLRDSYPSVRTTLTAYEWRKIDRAVIKLHLKNKRRRGKTLVARVNLDNCGDVSVSGVHLDQNEDPLAYIRSARGHAKIEFTEPAPWFYETGFAKYSYHAASIVPRLLSEIEKARTSTKKVINELLKPSRAT